MQQGSVTRGTLRERHGQAALLRMRGHLRQGLRRSPQQDDLSSATLLARSLALLMSVHTLEGVSGMSVDSEGLPRGCCCEPAKGNLGGAGSAGARRLQAPFEGPGGVWRPWVTPEGLQTPSGVPGGVCPGLQTLNLKP